MSRRARSHAQRWSRIEPARGGGHRHASTSARAREAASADRLRYCCPHERPGLDHCRTPSLWSQDPPRCGLINRRTVALAQMQTKIPTRRLTSSRIRCSSWFASSTTRSLGGSSGRLAASPSARCSAPPSAGRHRIHPALHGLDPAVPIRPLSPAAGRSTARSLVRGRRQSPADRGRWRRSSPRTDR